VPLRRCLPLLFLLAGAGTLGAQEPGPPGPFVIDVRGALSRFGENPQLAADQGVPLASLPGSGLGVTVGAHWYPLRRHRITFGLGGEALFSRGRRTPPAAEGFDPLPSVETRFSSYAPQLSFNFGTEQGWSYLSGGIGASRFSVTPEGSTRRQPDRPQTINYGGGARWFVRPRLAFTFDLRFYAVRPFQPTDTDPGRPRMTLMVVNLGASFK
jgi:hypothetical protein